MKLSIPVVFCLILALQYTSVYCGLVNNLFERGHETIETVKEKIQDILNLNKKGKEDEPDTLSRGPLPINSVKQTVSEMNKKDNIEKVTTTPIRRANSTTTTAAVTTSTVMSTTPASNSTEPQEGRDAFKGDACAKGYKPTTDGRCKKPVDD
ncbi:hypothetical protein O0L34_g8924 [Tuta absoluta]|nr:hypothetical protein O0L34_g8924 [Tuta absoluta]